jgi:hypothetical protein
MKKLLLILITALIFKTSVSQTSFNRAYHSINEQPNPFVVSIHGDIYFTTQNYDANQSINPTNAFLYKHSNSGVLNFRTQIPGFRTTYLGFKSLDDKLILVGTNSSCDQQISFENFISKMDGSGNAVFTSTCPIEMFDKPKAAFQSADSSYFVFTDSMMINYDKTGQFLSVINSGLTEISAAIPLSNSSILVSGKSGGITSLIVMTPSASILSNSSFPVLLRKLCFYGGQKIMGLGVDGKLYKFSPSINLINSTIFPGGFSISDFVCERDTVCSVTGFPSVTSNYAVLDTAFNSISVTATTTHSLNQVAVCLDSNNKTVILSSGKSKSSYSFPEHYYASLGVINKLGDNNFKNDISITALSADSSLTGCYQIPFPPYEYKCNLYLKARVTVKNNGPTVISNFKLNCFMATSLACGGFFYQEKFEGLSLAPGATMQVVSPFVGKSADPVSTSTLNEDYCFYVTLPNGETDKVVEDNELCNTFNFFITSLGKINVVEDRIIISPNPFENSLDIKSDNQIYKVEIFNSTGMLVNSFILNQKDVKLENNNLQPGIYFIKIETEKGTVVKKVVKN